MLSDTQAAQVIGSTAYDSEGNKIGKVGQLYLDDQTGQPEFLTVNTGLFGTSESFVPAQDATLDGDSVRVPFTKDKIKDAPNVDLDGGHLDEAEEERLFQYYGMASSSTSDVRTDARTGIDTDVSADRTRSVSDTTGTQGAGHDTSGPNTDDAMTRSEERLQVGKTTQEAGRARLRKYVTTEMETHTVPVTKERAVLETEPITDANAGAATSGGAITEEEHEVVLHEERAVVEKTVEPVERVRLGTETVTEEQTVTEEVAKEHIEADGDLDDRRR